MMMITAGLQQPRRASLEDSEAVDASEIRFTAQISVDDARTCTDMDRRLPSNAHTLYTHTHTHTHDRSPLQIDRSTRRNVFAFTWACQTRQLKAKFHYAILVADRSDAGRRPAASWNLAYH